MHGFCTTCSTAVHGFTLISPVKVETKGTPNVHTPGRGGPRTPEPSTRTEAWPGVPRPQGCFADLQTSPITACLGKHMSSPVGFWVQGILQQRCLAAPPSFTCIVLGNNACAPHESSSVNPVDGPCASQPILQRRPAPPASLRHKPPTEAIMRLTPWQTPWTLAASRDLAQAVAAGWSEPHPPLT